MVNIPEARQLAPVVGNYPDCIAHAALTYGAIEGNPSKLIDILERIVEVCPRDTTQATGELCLLAPVASYAGLVSIQSGAGQWWLGKQIGQEFRLKYPRVVLGTEVREFSDNAKCLDYVEKALAVSVTEQKPAVPLRDGDRLNSLRYLQASADPGNSAYLRTSRSMSPKSVTREEEALIAISDLVIAGMVDERPDVEASMTIDGNKVTIEDSIEGLIFHGNKSEDEFRGPSLPDDMIILPWPRRRSVEFELNDEDIHAFTHQI